VKIERFRKRLSDYYIDYSLIFIVLFLLIFGLVMVYSTSAYDASISAKYNNDPAYFLKKQLVATIIGIVAMVACTAIPYQFWKKFSLFGYLVSMASIFLVLTPLGVEVNGARRWINLGMSIQPAEIVKVAVVLFMAHLICTMGNKIKSTKGFWLVFFVPVPAAALVWLITENLSSAIIIFAIGFCMLFVASPDYKKFFVIVIGVLAIAAIMVYLVTQTDGFFGVRGARIKAWLDPEAYPSTIGFQTLQSLYAIGSGGIFGNGLGQSVQKLGFLPEAQNDMIFSIICEELGLFGGFCIILMFLLLIWRFMIIANNTTDLFGTLLVVGVMAHFGIQVILNIAVVTNSIPNTGVSLPFISCGGSSVVFLLIEVGLVLSVAKNIKTHENQ